MNQSLLRQRRLLTVRSLQADFAAAEVRRSQMAETEVTRELQVDRQAARADFGPILVHSYDPAAWLLGCAEQELAGIRIDLQIQALQEIEARTATLQTQEQQARQERDQIRKVCERLKSAADYDEQIREQAVLDDLFSAATLIRQKNRE